MELAIERTRSARGTKIALGAAGKSEVVGVDLMLFFYAVAEALCFTRAAQNLGIDQSWLSHKIRQFESEIGAKLFIRNTRKVELTAAGRTLLDPARRLAEMADQARAAARLLKTAVGGVLRVGALPFSFRDPQRVRILDEFMRDYPDVQVIVTNGTTPKLTEHLHNSRIDVAFVSAPIDLDEFDSILLRENVYCLLVPSKHPLYAVNSPTPQDLSGHRVVIPAQRYSPAAYDLIYRPVVEAGIIPVPVPEFECATSYARDLGLPVVCTRHAAECALHPGMAIRALEFVPKCRKFLIRLKDHRSSSQEALWNGVEKALHRKTLPN